MLKALEEIPDRIIGVARGSLSQAVHHAVFHDPGLEYWDQICVLNAAHAGELFLKAIVAREHPLLIFKEFLQVDNNSSAELDIKRLMESGRTYDFKDLPRLLWLTTGQRLPDMKSFEKIKNTRNAIQHFCAPDDEDLRDTALQFIFKNIDPLIHAAFGLFAIEHHEDHSVGYDYVVQTLIRREIKFLMPDDFELTEIHIPELLSDMSPRYRKWLLAALREKGIEIG